MSYLNHPSVMKVVDKAYAESVHIKRSDKVKRFMTIVKNNQTVCTLCILVNEAAPIFQSPTAVIDNKKFLEPTPDINKFDTYEFREFTPSYSNTVDNNFGVIGSYKIASDEDVKNMKEYVNNVLGNKPRFYPICTIPNPLTHTSYTFFVDRLHKDIFYISGLDLIVNDNVKPDPTSSINVIGTKVGGMPQSTTPGSIDNMTVASRLSNLPNDFQLTTLADDKATFATANIKAYAVTFTGDLPGNVKSGNYPVFYDRLTHINGNEIQIARQDTIPFLWVELGTYNDFANGKEISIPNYLIHNYRGNVYRLSYNSTHIEPNAKIAITIPVW